MNFKYLTLAIVGTVLSSLAGTMLAVLILKAGGWL